MKYLVLGLLGLAVFSCAPVKFSKSENVKVNVDSGQNNVTGVTCNPRIAPNATTYTYSGSGNPDVLSNCDQNALIYEWTLKRSDASIVAVSIPSLNGANPAAVDLRSLGEGTYYLFLTARDSNGVLSPFIATTPLEFVVPGANTGNSLTCDPKLNSGFTSLIIESNGANPVISANCTPAASMYLWSVTKDNNAITVAGLSGDSSTPDLKSYGVGTYRITLYATAGGSGHWQSTTPLVVTISQPQVEPQEPILCNPRINGSLTSITVTNSSTNPLISANCSPSSVQYAWRVSRSGQNVLVSDLNDGNSNPNFLALGNGTYLVYLTATKNGYSTWSTTTPLTVTVDNSGGSNLMVSCSPRFNADSTAVTITSQIGNPTLNSNCLPVGATHTWTVYRNGQQVNVANLSGAASTPDFLSAGLGTYYVYLTAQQAGYGAYVIPTPLEITVATVESQLRRVTLSKTVQATDNKVDILLVVDDSNSMLADNRKLAQRMQGFVNDLTAANVDWKMCSTVTRSQDINNNGVYYWGASRNWVNYVGSPRWILGVGATDPYSIFTSTIEAIGAGWAGSDDERGIKAAYWHGEYAQYNSCYRNDASLSVIVISDEDERSVGGDAAKVYYAGELKSLEADDLPQSYVNKIKQKFGMDKRFTVNSIIVKPGDSVCMAEQDAGGAKSHYGYLYDELSRLTNGFSSSICSTDYSQNLNYFKDRIISNLGSIPMECAPVGTIDVTVTPAVGGLTTRIENNSLVFTPAIPLGHQINIEYDCPRN